MREVGRYLCLCVALAGPARAEAPDCDALRAGLGGGAGYGVEVPPAAPVDGACVLDGLRLTSQTPGWPDLKADRLRIGGGEGWGSLEMSGLRATVPLSDRAMDDRLRQMLRLQTADLIARLAEGPEGVLELTEFDLALSGGTELAVTARLKGMDLSLTALPGAALTDLGLDWRSDGRLLRPVLEIMGERLPAGQEGDAVDAAREALAGVVAALPDAALAGDSRRELEAAVAALPQGRGRLVLRLEAPEGIGAATLALAAANAGLDEALTRLLAGATITADWQPGLQP